MSDSKQAKAHLPRSTGRLVGRSGSAKISAARAMLTSGNMAAIEVAQQPGCAPSTLYQHLPDGQTAIIEFAVSGSVDASRV